MSDLSYCLPTIVDAWATCLILVALCKVAHGLDQFFYEADYEKRIDACKQKTETAKSEVISDEELDLLQKELEEECEKESLLLEELR